MKIKVKFLGQGEFAKPIKAVLQKRFELVEDSSDIQVVANYGRILEKPQIVEPKYGTLNAHPSCLPKYRGATPLQTAILEGETKTCVCIIKMVEKIDAGPILACEELIIDRDETLETLTAKTAKLAAKILPYIILGYLSGSINPRKQDESQATYTKKLVKQGGLIDFKKPLEQIERQIRAFEPWPGSFIILRDSKRLILRKAHLENGKLVPEQVQLEGKKVMSWQEFKRGYRGRVDAFLS